MRTTVVIPTYAERENIGPLLDAVLDLHVPDLSVLVVDDNSPDGTGDIVRARAARDSSIHLLSRPHKEGLGRAYTAAFQYLLLGGSTAGDELKEDSPGPATPDATSGLSARAGTVSRAERGTSERALPEPATLGLAKKARGAGELGPGLRQDLLPPDIVIQMDADLSHNPADIPRLLDALDQASLAIGSRYVPGGGTVNWGSGRRLLSRGANAYAGLLTGERLHDFTSGFNAWRAPLLAAVHPETIRPVGYGYLIEMKVRAARLGARITEIPITFTERRVGQSKLSPNVLWEAIGVVLRLGLKQQKIR